MLVNFTFGTRECVCAVCYVKNMRRHKLVTAAPSVSVGWPASRLELDALLISIVIILSTLSTGVPYQKCQLVYASGSPARVNKSEEYLLVYKPSISIGISIVIKSFTITTRVVEVYIIT